MRQNDANIKDSSPPIIQGKTKKIQHALDTANKDLKKLEKIKAVAVGGKKTGGGAKGGRRKVQKVALDTSGSTETKADLFQSVKNMQQRFQVCFAFTCSFLTISPFVFGCILNKVTFIYCHLCNNQK